MKYLPVDNAASKLKPNGLLTVILTYAALNDVTQTLFTVFVSCKQDFLKVLNIVTVCVKYKN